MKNQETRTYLDWKDTGIDTCVGLRRLGENHEKPRMKLNIINQLNVIKKKNYFRKPATIKTTTILKIRVPFPIFPMTRSSSPCIKYPCQCRFSTRGWYWMSLISNQNLNWNWPRSGHQLDYVRVRSEHDQFPLRRSAVGWTSDSLLGSCTSRLIWKF